MDNHLKKFITRISTIVIALLLVQLVVGSYVLYQVAIKQNSDYLQDVAKRVNSDIQFNQNYWNLDKYNADPNLPGTYPLYIFSADGYVLDRWKPVHGFLDTSDFKHLLTYTTIQTINTITNQPWRVVSQPIVQNGHTIGVIMVGSIQQGNTSDIDTQLKQTEEKIAQHIKISNGKITKVDIDPRDFSYKISFQVVDEFNKILAKNNNNNSIDRIPNYIENSYIGQRLQAPRIEEIKDDQTGERFLIYTYPIVDSRNYVTGIIVVGRSVSYITTFLSNFLITEAIIMAVGMVLFIIILKYLTSTFLHALPQNETAVLPDKKDITSLSFDKKHSVIKINGEEYSIPYATNQYYLCEALFSHPKKRWEVDELLERFGDQDSSHNRKVYDAALIINKKFIGILGNKLVINKEKTYQLNPLLASFA